MHKLKVFYSYSHKDEAFRDQLETHLKLLSRNGFISEWHDRKISPGNEWKNKINDEIRSSNIILLLISTDFIASDYCYEEELRIAMEMHEENTAVVVPIILLPSRWKDTPFAKLQALPKDVVPISTWSDIDQAWLSVVEGLEVVIQDFQIYKERKQGGRQFHSLNELLKTEILELHKIFQNEELDRPSLRGIATGFIYLDKYLGGLHRSELTVLASRPSAARSDLALQIAANVSIKEKQSVAYFSFNISAERILRKLITLESGIPSESITKAELDEREWSKLSVAVAKIKDAPLFIDDSVSLGFDELKNKLAKIINDQGVSLVIIDGVEVNFFNEKELNGTSEYDFSKKIHNMVRSLGLPVLVTSSVNKNVERRLDSRPSIGDIDTVSSLDDVADNVIFLYRDKMFDFQNEKQEVIEVIIAKNNLMPKNIGTFNLLYSPECSNFFECESQT